MFVVSIGFLGIWVPNLRLHPSNVSRGCRLDRHNRANREPIWRPCVWLESLLCGPVVEWLSIPPCSKRRHNTLVPTRILGVVEGMPRVLAGDSWTRKRRPSLRKPEPHWKKTTTAQPRSCYCRKGKRLLVPVRLVLGGVSHRRNRQRRNRNHCHPPTKSHPICCGVCCCHRLECRGTKSVPSFCCLST